MNASGYADKIETLTSLLIKPVFDVSWPPCGGERSLLEVMEMAQEGGGLNELRSALASAKSQIAMLERPIVAVIGELNAGKSSVVASFLGDVGRRRIPRGIDPAKGTHRFVYWVPSKWLDEPPAKEAFLALLSAVHGPKYEMLSDEPEKAELQYRIGRENPKRLQTPLIASDVELDRIGLCVLDCPDVQTKDNGHETQAGNHRLDILACTAQICSALLVVWERSKVRDRLLDEMLKGVRKKLPQTPIHLLINKIEPETGQPGKTRSDPDVVALIERHALVADRVFGSFHFRIESGDGQPGWQELTPPALVDKFKMLAKSSEWLPQFFAISAVLIENEPTGVGDDRFLENLPRQLQTAELQHLKIAGTWTHVTEQTRNTIKEAEHFGNNNFRRAKELHDGLLSFCSSLLYDPCTKQPKQVLTPEFTSAFHQSLERTAPAWVWGTMQIAKPFAWFFNAAKDLVSSAPDLVSKLKKWMSPGEAVRDITNKAKAAFQEEFKTKDNDNVFAWLLPEDLAAQMKGLRWVPHAAEEAQINKAWTSVFKLMKERPLKPDSTTLDDLCSKIWESMSAWDQVEFAAKNLLKAAGTLAASVGVVIAAVDGGAMLFSASWLAAIIPGKALLLVAAGGAASVAGAEIILKSVEANTLPYLAQMFACAADAFRIPRHVKGCFNKVSFEVGRRKHEHELPDFSYPEQPCVAPLEPLILLEGTPTLQSIKDLTRQP